MHIGIIMDGNGRWATGRGLPRLSGHQAGVEAVKKLVRACPDMDVMTITLFAFAVANWKRDTDEVEGLWKIFDAFFEDSLHELIAEGVRIKIIGDTTGLPLSTQINTEKAEEASKNNSKFLLQVALNYDGVDEVVRMVKTTLENNVRAEDITPSYIQSHLDTVANNELDIVLRTGMPKAENGMSLWRSSAFLPVQSVQSVCVSSEILWPDFTPDNLKEIISFADLDGRLFGGQRT